MQRVCIPCREADCASFLADSGNGERRSCCCSPFTVANAVSPSTTTGSSYGWRECRRLSWRQLRSCPRGGAPRLRRCVDSAQQLGDLVMTLAQCVKGRYGSAIARELKWHGTKHNRGRHSRRGHSELSSRLLKPPNDSSTQHPLDFG
jgi:hypothetical protein